MKNHAIYEGITSRTNGEIYLGVVGPCRTGKSTFISQFMRLLVLPSVKGEKRKRMTDELPLSGAGKTVMTTEPKFVPEEAVMLSFGQAVAKIRLVDCVGYPVEGAAGFDEDGSPRLVRTPWSDQPMSFTRAAEEGTRKVICDHATIGVLVTTDGSIAELPRENYISAEERTVRELKELKKPFITLLNTKDVNGATSLAGELSAKYEVPVLAVDLENMTEKDLENVMERVLYEFPVTSIDVELPEWVRVLDAESSLIAEITASLKTVTANITKMSDSYLLDELFSTSEQMQTPTEIKLDPASGKMTVKAEAKEGAFFKMLEEQCGEPLKDDFDLMRYVVSSSKAKALYARVASAFEEAEEYGYGIVPPERNEMSLKEPKLVKRSGIYGVDLEASAPSYHIIRVDLSGEVRPTLGNEERSKQFVKEIQDGMEVSPETAWNTNMFGRTLKDMLGEELSVKNRTMATAVQKKMRRAVTRIVNEGKGGVICILL